jgi:hypothetical protein
MLSSASRLTTPQFALGTLLSFALLLMSGGPRAELDPVYTGTPPPEQSATS